MGVSHLPSTFFSFSQFGYDRAMCELLCVVIAGAIVLMDDVVAEFDSLIGLKYLLAMHINDSKTPLSSKKDRHENIGL